MRPATNHRDAWAIEARRTASEISISELMAKARGAEDGDRIAIFGDRILFEDASVPAPEVEERAKGLAARILGRDAESAAEAPEAASQPAPDANAANAQEPPPARFMIAAISHAGLDLLPDFLSDTKAAISVVTPRPHPMGELLDGLGKILPFLLLAMILMFFLRSGGPLRGGSHDLIKAGDLKDGLDDVAGIDSVREEVREIIEILRDPKSVSGMGARVPKGMLLSGPPGTGKTLLARAIAKEAGVSFLSIDAATLNQLYMGMGAMRVRKAFAEARRHKPCIIFMDEIDAVGSRDGGNKGDVGQEKSTTINAILTELDGIKQDEQIFLIGATNLPDRLDAAMTRPGRIDRKVQLTVPDRDGRAQILAVHAGKLPLAPDADLDLIAGSTPGFSGADLANLCNEAALRAARLKRPAIATEDFHAARDRMLVGQTGSQVTLDEEERELTAFHEAGHAVAAWLTPGADLIEKATILPQGGALGYVLQVPVKDRRMESRARLEGRMVMLAAGRAAEELRFGADQVTTGAASDIDAVTRIATNMVTRWGMGSSGFVSLAHIPGMLESDKVQEEIARIAQNAAVTSSELLASNRDLLDALAHQLLKQDTMTGQEITDLLRSTIAARTAESPVRPPRELAIA